VLPEIKEYERTSTTVINAYIGPTIRRYCQGLREALSRVGFDAPLRIMQSSGGVLSLDEVLDVPAYIVESGPAAGVIGAAVAGSRWGEPNLLTVDMGGTTAKAALIEDGQVARTSEYEVGAGINISSKLVKGGGHALKLPVIDVSEIGAGGGSIARVSQHGILGVGPESAGAVPGPACYASGGTSATLTDAMVTLGYVNPAYLVGGALPLDARRAREAVAADVAQPLALPLLDAAYGVFVLAAATMTRAVKAVSTFRGRDPRDFTLFAFGGNGPLMAAEIAGALDIGRVLCPRHAGLFSAVGLLDASMEREISRTLMRPLEQLDDEVIGSAFAALETELRDAYRTHACRDSLQLRRLADLRFHGQAFELTIAAPGGASMAASLRTAFVDEHRRTYGHGDEGDAVDLVNLRVAAVMPATADKATSTVLPPARTPRPARDVYFGPRWKTMVTPIIDRGSVATGVDGPVIVEEDDTTVLVPPAWRASLGADATIVLERQA
jgi:N-methylhydantoinase A